MNRHPHPPPCGGGSPPFLPPGGFEDPSAGGRGNTGSSSSSSWFPAELSCGRDYHNNLLRRFQQVNQHCDTSLMDPVTFNSVNKLWLGGSDVLDYVVCYATKGNPMENVPDHWHYVSFGLSDIHGIDTIQIHKGVEPMTGPSGFGFELTFRLKAEVEGIPPAWPVDLLQKLAKYVHTTPECLVVPGDHITWHAPLHGNHDVECEINHMLIATDASIPKLETPTGSVTFHQIVGVTYSEVELAQKWNAKALLNLFKEQEGMGGTALVTDIFRRKGILELYSDLEAVISDGIERDGSDLTGVGGRALWTQNAGLYCDESHWWALSESERRLYIEFESNSPTAILTYNEVHDCSTKSANQNDIDQISSLLEEAKLSEPGMTSKYELPIHIRDRIIYPSKVQLTMSPESAKLLPLALKGRVDHKRHFTIKDSLMNDVITFVPKGMAGAFTTDGCSFAACGSWLHIQLNDQARKNIVRDVETLFSSNPADLAFPRFLVWPDANFALTILEIRD